MRFCFKILVITASFLFCKDVFSQSASQALAQGQDVNVLFRNESTGSIFMHSRGFGANYRRLWHVTGKLKRLIEIEGLNMRNPKQEKIKPDGGKSYYYGKLNGLLFIRAGFGFQRALYQRAERKSIEIRAVYTVGPSFCFSKPVYLEIELPDPTNPNGYVTKNLKYDPLTQNQGNILGRAPGIYGLQSLQIHPGVYGKLGFSFEYGALRNSIKAIEVGAVVDYFPGAIQTMAYNKASNLFVTLYLGFHFGKRWF